MKRHAAILFLSVAFAGCSTAPVFERAYVNPEPAARARANDLFQDAFPSSFKARLRLVIEVRGRRLDFPAYLVMDRADGRGRLVGLAEMGGTLFEALNDGKKTRVVRKAAPLPDRFIEKGLFRDLQRIFGAGVALPGHPVFVDKGNPGIQVCRAEVSTAEYYFNGTGAAFSRVVVGRGARVIFEAEYASARSGALVVSGKNYRGGYRFECQALSIQEIDDSAPFLNSRDAP